LKTLSFTLKLKNEIDRLKSEVNDTIDKEMNQTERKYSKLIENYKSKHNSLLIQLHDYEILIRKLRKELGYGAIQSHHTISSNSDIGNLNERINTLEGNIMKNRIGLEEISKGEDRSKTITLFQDMSNQYDNLFDLKLRNNK